MFGCEAREEAAGKIDPEILVETSRRLWLITLCEQQERLVIAKEHMGELMKFMHVSKGSDDV